MTSVFNPPPEENQMRSENELDRYCELMHDVYERVAAHVGWETQRASRKPWADVPEQNKAPMRAAVQALLSGVSADLAYTRSCLNAASTNERIYIGKAMDVLAVLDEALTEARAAAGRQTMVDADGHAACTARARVVGIRDARKLAADVINAPDAAPVAAVSAPPEENQK